MKVEQFELTDPLGQHNIFSQFDTGLVYFKLTNSSDIGVWSYRVKLYENIKFPAEGYTVDITAGLSGDDAVRTITEWVDEHSNWDESVLIVTADHGHYLHFKKPELLIPSSDNGK